MGGWKKVHEPLPEDFEEDTRLLVCSLGFVECMEKYGVELEATEMDGFEEVKEGAIFLCG